MDAGIYVDDILEAVPIDKYFELFKPKNGGEGGFIRVAMNFSTESAEDALAGDAMSWCRGAAQGRPGCLTGMAWFCRPVMHVNASVFESHVQAADVL
jgi:hypothetical protein